MAEPDDKTSFGGLDYASLNYTEAEYAEAVKLADSPASASDILGKLIDNRCRAKRYQDSDSTSSPCDKNQNQAANQTDESLLLVGPDRESSSSCYSSISCSLDQSLESLQVNGNNNLLNLRKIYIDGPNVART